MQTQDGIPVQAPAGRQRAAESKPEAYLRQIRNILAWILAIWVLMIAGGIITGIVIAHHASTSSNCLSQGGTDVSC